MIVRDVESWLDETAPVSTAIPRDNVGLIVGDSGAAVEKVLFTVDCTPEAVHCAASVGASLIVSHHPLLFLPAKQILFSEWEGAAIRALCTNGISLIAAHTNLDAAQGGIADSLADTLRLRNTRVASDGIVRAGELETPLDSLELEELLGTTLDFQVRRYAKDDQPRQVTTVALGVGAYSEGWRYALETGAQAYVTGEIEHHDALPAVYQGLTLYECGHYATERFGIERLRARFDETASSRGWQATTYGYSHAPYLGATLTP